jgi:hypothetical protein
MGHCIISPQCFSSKATREVTIEYNEIEKDVLNLCEECAGYLKKDACRYGYKVSARKINPE